MMNLRSYHTRINIIYNMCIQPNTEIALRALQHRRRSHHYGLRSQVSQGSPEERRAQAPRHLRSSTALACKDICARLCPRDLCNHLPHAIATDATLYSSPLD